MSEEISVLMRRAVVAAIVSFVTSIVLLLAPNLSNTAVEEICQDTTVTNDTHTVVEDRVDLQNETFKELPTEESASSDSINFGCLLEYSTKAIIAIIMDILIIRSIHATYLWYMHMIRVLRLSESDAIDLSDDTVLELSTKIHRYSKQAKISVGVAFVLLAVIFI